ncbi:MAG TPA: biotin-dependent carboxyltransferase family protein [Bacillota bacterium]|nr:biotin-dependent carboxyltransferase family protein [Bacillota bacterium]
MTGCVRVIKPGPLSSVQDLGRPGAMAWGVPHSGAVDAVSLRIANLLVGNGQDAAALETTMGGVELEFLKSTVVAVMGAPGSVTIDGEEVGLGCPVEAKPGSVLKLGGISSGMRQYIAFRGGLDVPVVLGSRSTYLKGALGGLEGRALKMDDVLGVLPDGPCKGMCTLVEGFANPSLERDGEGRCLLRVTQGTMDARFLQGEIDRMLGSDYIVSTESDRMGIRLKGYSAKHSRGADILSGGIEPGAVQVPGSGEPIILASDRQTTGGYTKAFSVISADRPKLGQLRPSDIVRFRMVGIDDAYGAYVALESLISRCTIAIGGKGRMRTLKLSIDGRIYDVEVEEIA